jgi:hypothetical protein
MRCLAALLLSLVVAACAAPAPTPEPSIPTVSPVPTPSPPQPSVTAPTSSPSPAPAESPEPSPSITCVQEITAGPAIPLGEPCVSAIPAVRAVVAPLGLPIVRMYVEPGPFQCGVIWPGLQSMSVCAGIPVIPGAQMHGWVAFTGTAKVAAVSLFRAPPEGTTPSGPWQATIVAFGVPPTGWMMP